MTAMLSLIRPYFLSILRTLFTDSLPIFIDGLRLRIFSDGFGALEETCLQMFISLMKRLGVLEQ
ncbi:hypothetical protein Desfe_0518 [Desulfurococcus amylolyticus DSM 16532]|uniref:Uncharacterized protein n=1 Tax=Desulfurococcus amylolyticus DSM 16532 TaxID=768672 RepID=I3XR48_DESAM|nr:hypothetical protein Desfe_0518 [Desulfurococcus amylolyticus DSM 16532]